MKSGFKSSELIVALATIVATTLPLAMDKLPAGSVWVAVLGAVLAAATYIAGRSHVKATDIKARALEAAAKASEAAAGK